MSSNFFSRVGAIVIIAVGVGLLLSAFFSFFGTQNVAEAPEVASEESATSFTSDAYGFSVRYPNGFLVQNDYRYAALGPGREIPGVAFLVHAVLIAGTNLSADSALTVEVLENVESCTADLFVGEGAEVSSRTDVQGRTWSVAEVSDAGAGNLYYSRVNAIAWGPRCYGLRLFAHTTRIENYDPGTVTEYDRAALDRAYEAFVASFQITP